MIQLLSADLYLICYNKARMLLMAWERVLSISETTCFPANCVEPTHLDSLLVGKECVKWSRKALDGFHSLNVVNGWGEFVSLVTGIVSAGMFQCKTLGVTSCSL